MFQKIKKFVYNYQVYIFALLWSICNIIVWQVFGSKYITYSNIGWILILVIIAIIVRRKEKKTQKNI
jgi:hypothetical protein